MALEVARAEVQALTGAMVDAAGAVLAAPDLSADEVGKGLRDVVDVFSKEIERRIPGWVSPGEARTDADPVPTEEKPMELSEKDKRAIVIAKGARQNPELKERMRKVDEARAAKEPIEKMHPVSKMAEDSQVLAEYEVEVLEVMSKERCSHEVAIGKIARDPAYHDLKRRYREEQRAMRDG
jgi:gas vesicle protein